MTEHNTQINSAAAGRLAARLNEMRTTISRRVSIRLLAAFPEIEPMLNLEGNKAAEDRLILMAVDRFSELVRGILIFESLTIADNEFRWAAGVLPRSGVTLRHQSSMVRWFFAEVCLLGLDDEELTLARDIEHHILDVLNEIYKGTS